MRPFHLGKGRYSFQKDMPCNHTASYEWVRNLCLKYVSRLGIVRHLFALGGHIGPDAVHDAADQFSAVQARL